MTTKRLPTFLLMIAATVALVACGGAATATLAPTQGSNVAPTATAVTFHVTEQPSRVIGTAPVPRRTASLLGRTGQRG